MLRTPPHPAIGELTTDRTERLLAAVRVALVAALTALVLAIAALAYVVSFEAIRAFAIETAAFPPELAWSAPLLVDSFTTAASLVILWRYLRGEGWRAPWYAWTLVGCATAVSVALNVAHAPDRLSAQLFAALPPVALLGALELLMSVARTGLPHTHRTPAANGRSIDRDPPRSQQGSRSYPHPTTLRPPATAAGRSQTAAPECASWSPTSAPPAPACTPATSPPRPGSANAAPTSCYAPSAPRSQRHDPAALPGLPGRRPLTPHRLRPRPASSAPAGGPGYSWRLMDGIHDLGGMHGFGAVVVPGGEALYHERWEPRVFALQLLVEMELLGARPGGRAIREEMDPVDYLAASYYERWLWSVEQGLLRRGTIAAGEVEHMMERLAAGGPEPPAHRDPDQAARFVEWMGEVVPMQPATRPRFVPGQGVRVRRMRPAGHTRCPRYVRGALGVVERVRGAEELPDVAVYRKDAPVEPVYAVVFRSDALWGRGQEPPWTVALDLWESYLEEAE